MHTSIFSSVLEQITWFTMLNLELGRTPKNNQTKAIIMTEYIVSSYLHFKNVYFQIYLFSDSRLRILCSWF
jgi:hypothetical protein